MSISTRKSRRSISSDESRCAGCRTCMLRCSFQHHRSFNLSAARIQIQRLVNQDHEFRIAFTGACDTCGVCVNYCPYGALSKPEAKAED